MPGEAAKVLARCEQCLGNRIPEADLLTLDLHKWLKPIDYRFEVTEVSLTHLLGVLSIFFEIFSLI